jgi:hypothetical protein
MSVCSAKDKCKHALKEEVEFEWFLVFGLVSANEAENENVYSFQNGSIKASISCCTFGLLLTQISRPNT